MFSPQQSSILQWNRTFQWMFKLQYMVHVHHLKSAVIALFLSSLRALFPTKSICITICNNGKFLGIILQTKVSLSMDVICIMIWAFGLLVSWLSGENGSSCVMLYFPCHFFMDFLFYLVLFVCVC